MVDIENYEGREQAYIKHFFFKNYIETLFFRLSKSFTNIVYVDGFSGPWQSQDDKFLDTSFGIALNAMRMVKAHAKQANKTITFTAHLVEKNREAYGRLAKIPAKFPEITVNTYHGDFLDYVGEISKKIDKKSFSFIFIDPKGWNIDLAKISPLISTKNSEVIFNFMFDFINRFVSHSDPVISGGLDKLFPCSENWREKISPHQNPSERKNVIFDEFAANIAQVGGFDFVSQTEILKPTRDRALYALFFATRSAKGIEVFRHQQVRALRKQVETRGETKMRAKAALSGQEELFGSVNEVAPNQTEEILNTHEAEARAYILERLPFKPNNMQYEALRLETAKRFVVNFAKINTISKQLMDEKLIDFLDWEQGRTRPQANYRVHRLNSKLKT